MPLWPIMLWPFLPCRTHLAQSEPDSPNLRHFQSVSSQVLSDGSSMASGQARSGRCLPLSRCVRAVGRLCLPGTKAGTGQAAAPPNNWADAGHSPGSPTVGLKAASCPLPSEAPPLTCTEAVDVLRDGPGARGHVDVAGDMWTVALGAASGGPSCAHPGGGTFPISDL